MLKTLKLCYKRKLNFIEPGNKIDCSNIKNLNFKMSLNSYINILKYNLILIVIYFNFKSHIFILIDFNFW